MSILLSALYNDQNNPHNFVESASDLVAINYNLIEENTRRVFLGRAEKKQGVEKVHKSTINVQKFDC